MKTNKYTSVSDLLYDIETRPYGNADGEIYVALFHKKYFTNDRFDDHDVVYNINDIQFYQEFKRVFNENGYDNEFKPIKLKTESDCIKFLNSIGLEKV